MARITVACKLPAGINLGPVTLNGSQHPSAVGGFGLTPVDADFWAEWSETHKGFAPLVKGLIFAMPTRTAAVGQANERADVKSGFEPLDPDKPPAGLEETDESKSQRRGARLRTPEADAPEE